MHLERIIPKNLLRYRFPAVTSLDVPAVPTQAFPISMQGVLRIGGMPTGAQVALGGGGAPDALRGSIELLFYWTPLGTSNDLVIQVYQTTDTRDPAYIPSVPNAIAGRTSIQTVPGDTARDVALQFQTAILIWLNMLGLGSRYVAEGGQVTVPATPSDILILVTPRTYRATVLVGASDAMLGALAASLLQSAVVIPLFFAGFHPGPWLLYGDAFEGFQPPARAE
jgi:hypothetical protein